MRHNRILGLLVVILTINYTCQAKCNNYEHSTECELNNGTVVCCPIKDASCCSTGDYCCPKGFECDVSNGRCLKNSLFIPFHLKYENIEVEKNVVCPDNLSECPSKTTCCQMDDGSYGCCPIPDAVCCNDHIHCCPDGYKCDTKDGRCSKGDLSIEIFKKTKSLKNVVCPDKDSECPSGATCCLLADGNYGCCPVQNAVCCDDHIHCCPEGYKCDTKESHCNKGDVSLPFYTKIKSVKPKKMLKNVVCPDKDSECPSDSTCCLLADGNYGCCPVQNANCCDDHIHCCPSGYTCDTKSGRCNKGDSSIEIFLKSKSIQIKKNVVCPDNLSECPSETTCCQMDDGSYGCCPIPNAVCCNDHIHCCPDGYKCDTKDGRCSKGDLSLPFYTKIKSIPKIDFDHIICPDGLATCPSDSTCCQMVSGNFACCPVPNATCCEDQLHCCPNGYKCDIADGKCVNGEVSIPLQEKTEAAPIKSTSTKTKLEIQQCSNHKVCAPGSTCCLLLSGQWGCCPLSNAVCCNDDLHCCPNGFSCDMETKNCYNKLVTIPFYKKTVALDKENKLLPEHKSPFDRLKSVVCPDGSSFCPNENTCCKMFDGSYGCCPMPEANCCADEVHCCPKNTKCNVTKGTCDSETSKDINWFRKEKAQKFSPSSEEKTVLMAPLVCPDNTTCDARGTCCKQTDNSFGCCPYTNGVCCSNSAFCCPEDSSCGKRPGECIQNKNTIKLNIPYFNWHRIEEKAQQIEMNEEKVCTESSKCPKPDGSFGCCPYKNGTCCGSDGYCCPDGYRCDPKIESCTLIDPDNIRQVKLRSTFDTCPEQSKCSIPSGGFGCCPYRNGTCCGSDGYCCPDGYRCDPKIESCTLIDPDNVKQIKPKVTFDTCPEQSKCSIPSGGFGCCPYRNGTCCGSNGLCCPHKYTCNEKDESCLLPSEIDNHIEPIKIKDDILLEKTLTHRIKLFELPKSVQCNDSIHFCPDTYSCCPKKPDDNGMIQYGCCPVVDAVCCDDGINCCPKGYECSNDALTSCKRKIE